MISGDRGSGVDQLDNGGPGHDVHGMEEGVDNVLVLSRTGLIFTGLQEGVQPGGLTQPQPAKQSRVFHTCASCWVPVGGSWAGGTHSRHGSVQRQQFGRATVLYGLFCRVFSFSVSLFFLFPLFAVLLNCPYPDPPVSAFFFPFSSAPC